jgi:hypothetical protein
MNFGISAMTNGCLINLACLLGAAVTRANREWFVVRTRETENFTFIVRKLRLVTNLGEGACRALFLMVPMRGADAAAMRHDAYAKRRKAVECRAYNQLRSKDCSHDSRNIWGAHDVRL